MSTALNFALPVPSLKHMSLARILNSLLPSFNSGDTTFKNVFRFLEDILPHLADDLIPKHDLENFRHLVVRLFSYFEYLLIVNNVSFKSLRPKEAFRHFIFTSRGTLNYIETVRNIVSDESFDVVCRYRLACEYHLEERIRALWERMRPEMFHQFDVATIKNREKYKVALWSLKMLELEDEMRSLLVEPDDDFPELSLNALAFKKLLEKGDEYGVKCFIEKISEVEKSDVFDTFVIDPDREVINKLYFSLLTRPQLEIVLRNDDGLMALFTCLASRYLPDHELFPRLFDSFFSRIDEERFFKILLITTKFSDYPWDVPSFEWLWMNDKIPESYREYALNKPGKDGVALLLFRICYSQDITKYRWTLSFDLVTRCARKDQFQIIFAGFVDLIQSYPVEYKYSDEISALVVLLKICARKMVTSPVDLDYVKDASSPILDFLEKKWKVDQENGWGRNFNTESWGVFLSNMERRFSESANMI